MAAKPAAAEAAAADADELAELLSKLNPSAEEFVPPSRRKLSPDAPIFVSSADLSSGYQNTEGDGIVSEGLKENSSDTHPIRRRKNGRRRMNERMMRSQREESIKRTVYVSDVDQQITEEQLARLFGICGRVRDCRICGDPHSVLRFAFIEFDHEYGARIALGLRGTMLGYYPVRVLPSKTAILPVNPKFLPQSEDDWEMVARTVYCTNIDKMVTQTDVKVFFRNFCGEVSRLRLLGDHVHSTRIAFVEFVQAESAVAALNCSGHMLGALPVRVSPSKTPVRPRFQDLGH